MPTWTPPMPQRPMQTLSYRTFFKRLVVQALRDGFANHPDPTVASCFVTLDFDQATVQSFPLVLVKFRPNFVNNIGLGHVEWLPVPGSPDPPTNFIKYYHRWYKGEVSFTFYARTSLDKDTLADAFVEVAGMWDTTTAGSNMWTRLYDDNTSIYYGAWHYVVLNTGVIHENDDDLPTIAPWIPEDILVYPTTFNIPVMGEFYSNTPPSPTGTGFIEQIDLYPWDPQDPLDVNPANFPGGIIPQQDYIVITGPPAGQTNL